MNKRILIVILLPLALAAGTVVILASAMMIRPLVGILQENAEHNLRLLARLGLASCERSFRDVIDRGLELDQDQVAEHRHKALAQVAWLSDQDDILDIIVLDANGELLRPKNSTDVQQAFNIKGIDVSGVVGRTTLFGKPVRYCAGFLEGWRWHVVAFISEDSYMAPVILTRKTIFGFAGLAIGGMILTVGLVVFYRVYLPLRRILRTAEISPAGEYKKIHAVGKDEIGRVATIYNGLVNSLNAQKLEGFRILSAWRESEETCRVILESSPCPIVFLNKGRILFANRCALENSGYAAEEIDGRPAIMHLHSDDHRIVRRAARLQCLRQEVPGPVECRYYTKKGELRWLELDMVRISYKDQPVLVVHGIDTTLRNRLHAEKERLEVKLRQAQKMEAIGTLAGGIAHDFNNLLMGIQGNISLLKLGVWEGMQMQEKYCNIEQYVRNGAELTRQLLGYARGGKDQAKPIRINNLVSESARMFGRTKKEIVLHFDLALNGWTVEVDRGQIEQVLLNLFVNAWQAMPGGGRLFITTRNVNLVHHQLQTFPPLDGDFVLITVTDTGTGMDQQTLEKIFDPFFTTKQRGRGTGLGLASAYGIIKSHEGAIFCESRVGQGTTFSIYLPRTDKAPEQEFVFDERIKVGTETILLIDDEEMILDVGRDLLEHLGYKVLTARNGRLAIEQFKRAPDTIDLVILDMVMPEMGGTETFEALRGIRPDIPVLLCSGYNLSGPAAELMTRGCNGFIQKPFNLDVLSNHIRRILDKTLSREDLSA